MGDKFNDGVEDQLQGLGAASEDVQVVDEEARTVQERFVDFLRGFSLGDLLAFENDQQIDDDLEDFNADDVLVYAEQIQLMKNHEHSTLRINFQHLMRKDMILAEAIKEEYYRYAPYLNRAVQIFIHGHDPEFAESDSGEREFYASFYSMECVEKIRSLRTDKIGKLISVSGTVTRTSEVRPEVIFATFECRKCGRVVTNVEQQFKITYPRLCKTSQCSNMGGNWWKLIQEEGKFADWQKLRAQENSNEVPAGSMPRSLDVVVRHEAVEKAKPGDKCVFVGTLIAVPDVAKLKGPSDGPGILPAPRGRTNKEDQGHGVTGIQALGVREMSYKLAFLACSLEGINARFGGIRNGSLSSKRLTKRQRLHLELARHSAIESLEEESAESIRAEYSDDDLEELRLIARQSNLVLKMRRSVAPSIFGHENIKLGILLLMFGGVHKRTSDGAKLRGDINICIVGDPSTAKSQFLKYVCGFLPRAIFTSGKASSAAGLTASVVKDAESGEYCVEAGALMLADNGICCIDEFDKMEDTDQVAIHEAMEQQTISITKAGIQATLNARTSILAAANPIHGRYDRTKTLQRNLQLSAAIMSRFDLFFVVIDECNEMQDRIVAEHIIRVHRKRIARLSSGRDPEDLEDDDVPVEMLQSQLEHGRDDGNGDNNQVDGPSFSQREQGNDGLFTSAQLRNYIRYARTIDPILPPSVQPKLVECYRKLREGDLSFGGRSNQAYRITVRQLEALVRLAEALARLHLDEEVRPRHVDWAYHLLKTSIVQVESGEIVVDDVGDVHNASALDRQSRKSNLRESNGFDKSANEHSDSDRSELDSDDNESGRDFDESNNDDDENTANNKSEKRRNNKSAKSGAKNVNRKQKTLSLERYMEITKMLVTFTRRREEELQSEGRKSAVVRQRELVIFYLESIAIDSEEDLVEERKLVNSVIRRLIDVDHALMEPLSDTLADDHEIMNAEDDEFEHSDEFPMESRWLCSHPNYDCS